MQHLGTETSLPSFLGILNKPFHCRWLEAKHQFKITKSFSYVPSNWEKVNLKLIMVEISWFLLMELWETLSHTLHFKMVWEIVLNQVVTSTWLKAPLWTKESSSKIWQVTLMFMKKAHKKTFLTREKLDIQIKIWTVWSIFFIFQCIRKGRLNLTDQK